MISFTGRGTPRFEHSGTSFDYTPTDQFEHPIRDELVDANITRPSIKDGTVKVIKKGQWVRNQYVFRESKDIIDKFIAIAYEDITFTPDNTKGFSYYSVVEGIDIDDTDPLRVYVIVTILSKYYTDPATSITVTAPDGGETYQRNQTVTITWTSNILPASEILAIELWKNGSKDSDIDTSGLNDGSYTWNDGSYTWTVPADATIGTDYKVKVKTTDGLIYDLSDADFTIAYDGYALFDGDNDQVQVPFGPGGKKQRTFAFTYYGASAVDAYTMGLFTSYNSGLTFERFYISGTNIKYNRRYSTVSNDTSLYYASDVITREAWQTIVLVLDIEQAVADDRVRIWIDGSEITLTVSVADSGTVNNTANYQLGVCLTDANFKGKMKNVVMTETAWTQTDIDNYQNRVFGTTKALYRMNDADPGSPYTGGTVDSSGNGNHGTPVNIDGATFFNQV